MRKPDAFYLFLQCFDFARTPVPIIKVRAEFAEEDNPSSTSSACLLEWMSNRSSTSVDYLCACLLCVCDCDHARGRHGWEAELVVEL